MLEATEDLLELEEDDFALDFELAVELTLDDTLGALVILNQFKLKPPVIAVMPK